MKNIIGFLSYGDYVATFAGLYTWLCPTVAGTEDEDVLVKASSLKDTVAVLGRSFFDLFRFWSSSLLFLTYIGGILVVSTSYDMSGL